MAKETEGGTWINVNSNDEKGHVNIYGSNPREPHDESIHININYNDGSFSINEKSNGEKTSTDCHCYLTTACMRHQLKKFDDNCEELKTLRWFRDNFVSNVDIEHYYQTAPIIVEAINDAQNNNEIYNYIYMNVIKPCVDAIKSGNYIFAYSRYKSSVLALEEKFAKPKLATKLVKTLKLKINN